MPTNCSMLSGMDTRTPAPHWRKILRWGLTAAVVPATVIITLNIETVADKLGFGTVLYDNLGAALSVLLAVCWIVVGAAAALWIDRILRNREGDDSEPPHDPKWAEKLQLITGRRFLNETVHLDGKRFINCRFDNVTFVYNGGPISMEQIEVGTFVITSDNPKLNRFSNILLALGYINTPVVSETTPEMSADEFRKRTFSVVDTRPKKAPTKDK